MRLQNELWDFALQLYRQDGVEQACLVLQQGWRLSINRLLFCFWLASEARVLQPDELLKSDAAEWQHDITAPLRALRYRVRAQKQREPVLADCYRALRQAELAAEQVELAHLFELARGWPSEPGTVADDLVVHNLCVYLRAAELSPEPALVKALQGLLEAAIPTLPAEQLQQLRW